MGLHPAFFTITIVGWVFAGAGVLYHDDNARDIGLLVAIGSLAIGLLIDSSPIRAITRERAPTRPARSDLVESVDPGEPTYRTRSKSRFSFRRAEAAETDFEQVLPAPPAPPAPPPAMAASTGPSPVTGQWGTVVSAWERPIPPEPAPFAAPREPRAATAPIASVGPRGDERSAQNIATVAGRDDASWSRAVPVAGSQGGDRYTRGICGKCRSPITVSNRRPIRVTCPVCGNTKLLQ
ncbi:MAG: hypothetical protein ACYDDF_14200 [Thermoplasmatota archaeon]